jgi:hypothetical protein
MTTAHTPGPWQSDGRFITAADPLRIHSDVYIAEIVETDDDGRIVRRLQRSANADLIAAAPELLEAAEQVIANWERGDLAAPVRNLDAATARARGGSP